MDSTPGPRPRSFWRRCARKTFESAASLAARVNLNLALRSAAAFGRLARAVASLEPSIEEVSDAYGLRRSDATTVARTLSGRHQQTRLLMTLIQRHGIEAFIRRVEFDDRALSALADRCTRAPVLFLTWHVGPLFALGCAFSRLGIPVLAIRRTNGWFPATPGVDLAATDGSSEKRAAAFAKGLSRLREGGIVLMAADARGFATTAPVPFFGRAVAPARGPFALARMTGVPVVPVVTRYTPDGKITLILGNPSAPDGTEADVETALAATAMAWLESYVRRHPGELWLGTLRWLREAPRLQDAATISRAHRDPRVPPTRSTS